MNLDIYLLNANEVLKNIVILPFEENAIFPTEQFSIKYDLL